MQITDISSTMNTSTFSCTYIPVTGKKRKVSLDGKVVVTDQFLTLVTVEDKYVKRFFRPKNTEICSGAELELEGFEISVEDIISGGNNNKENSASDLALLSSYPQPVVSSIQKHSRVGAGVGVTVQSTIANRYSNQKVPEPVQKKVQKAPSTFQTGRYKNKKGKKEEEEDQDQDEEEEITSSKITQVQVQPQAKHFSAFTGGSSSSSVSSTAVAPPKGLFISSSVLRKLRPHQIKGANFMLAAVQVSTFRGVMDYEEGV